MALDATVEEVCEWYAAGESIEAIAKRLGRAPCYVDYRLKKAGAQKRPVGRGSAPRPERRIPGHLREEALALYRSGMSAKAISGELPISKHTVLRLIEEAGLEKRYQKTDVGEEAEKLYTSGLSAKKIGAELGVDKKTVLRYLAEREVCMRTQKCQHAEAIIEAYTSGMSADEISEKFDVSAGHVFMTLRKAGIKPRKPTRKNIDIDMESVLRDYQEGMTPAQIGNALGVTGSTILNRLSRMGVKIRTWVAKYDYCSPCAGDIRVNGTWELAYAKILDMMFISGVIQRWEYEPDKIPVCDGKHYIPDFKVFHKSGGFSYHEIKGKLWKASAEKIASARENGHNVVLLRRSVLSSLFKHYGFSVRL